jgi:NHL repeat
MSRISDVHPPQPRRSFLNQRRKPTLRIALLILSICSVFTGSQQANAAPGDTTTLTGNGLIGSFDGTGGPTGTTQFNEPFGIAIDSAGTIYVADFSGGRIRKINSTTGATTTLAGNGMAGFIDGTGGPTGTTQFNGPTGLAVDNAGNLYVGDTINNRIRKVNTTTGATTTLTGNGTAGFTDGTGGPTGTTQFRGPEGLAVDNAGNLYVADGANHRIRKVNTTTGATTTLTGNGTPGFTDGTGGPTGTTQLRFPEGLALDNIGNLYIADEFRLNHSLRKASTTTGATTTLTGNGTAGYVDGTGGPTGTTQFRDPTSIAIDAAGNLYVTDRVNHRIRKVDAATGVTSTFTGNGTPGFFDGTGGPTGTTRFFYPSGAAIDSAGNLIIVDNSNHRIRKIDTSVPAPVVTTITTTVAPTTTTITTTTTTTSTTIALVFVPIPQPATTTTAVAPTTATTTSSATATTTSLPAPTTSQPPVTTSPPATPTTPTTPTTTVASQPTTAAPIESAPATPVNAAPTFAG